MLALSFIGAITDSELFPDSQGSLVMTNLALFDSFLGSESPCLELTLCFPRKVLEISQLPSLSSQPQKNLHLRAVTAACTLIVPSSILFSQFLSKCQKPQ